MKKSICSFRFIFLLLILSPVTAGTTNAAAQPQYAPILQEQSAPAAAEEHSAPVAEWNAEQADAPASEQHPPAYEEILAGLISDFEAQGGSHGSAPSQTFHEETADVFSPHIFSVALSKEPENERKINVSRMMEAEEKQRIEIVYPGRGWVYVGEQTAQQGLRYEQRKLQDNTSIFTFIAEKKGDYVLHFSYFDVFTNDFITDAVAVSIIAAKSSAAKSTVRAPDYKNETETLTDAETETPMETTAQMGNQQQEPDADGTAEAPPVTQTARDGNTPMETTAATDMSAAATESVGDEHKVTGAADTEKGEELTADQLLEKARAAISAADAASALQYLETFFAAAAKDIDEGWFLRGRAYELNGSVRNIRLALDAYRTLTAAFPQSKYWAEADARIRYITNFYINIQ